MIRLVLPLTLLLAGCGTTMPVTPDPVRMPALPANLAKRAEPLPPITATDTHGLIREGMATDRQYADVRDQLNAIITAYDCVREAINQGTDAAKCFGGAE